MATSPWSLIFDEARPKTPVARCDCSENTDKAEQAAIARMVKLRKAGLSWIA
jgi:hypothetical protein